MSFTLRKPVTTKSQKEFLEKAGAKKTLVAPRRCRVKLGSDPTAIGLKIAFFGGWSTGKTLSISALLERGYNVVYLTTDIGGDGTLSVRLDLRQRLGEEEANKLLSNLHILTINGNTEMQEFLKEPAAFVPYIYELKDVVLFWDGFSGWQVNDLFEMVGANAAAEAFAAKDGNPKVIGDNRAEGNKFETQDWGVIRNATLKTLDKFTTLNNKLTGEIWHKIVTCQEAVKSKPSTGGPGGGGFIEAKEPFLSGAASKFFGGAFDVVVRTTVRTVHDKDEGERLYQYILQANQVNTTKVRGFILPPIMPADMGVLWDELVKQAGIVRGAALEEAKGEVLVGGEEEVVDAAN